VVDFVVMYVESNCIAERKEGLLLVCAIVLTIEREKETTPCDGENQIGEREQEACCFLRWMGACLLVDLSAMASREREWISARVCC
jgi:hypothetical protein